MLNMTSQTQTMMGVDASALRRIANILLIIGVAAVYQSGFEFVYTLGLVTLGLGFLGTLASLVIQKTHPLKLLEQVTVVGMFIGILGMLQSWNIKLYEYGFVLLGLCTLAFIVIIHIPVSDTE